MKGIILAGGAGSRLYPLTLVAGKQLQTAQLETLIGRMPHGECRNYQVNEVVAEARRPAIPS